MKDADSLFREAVTAIDAGDVAALERLIAEHPRLLSDRLEAPGDWLREQVGDAVEGFFQRPYLLWFVAEDPVRNGKLPANIADVARTIIQAAQRVGVESLHEQLDYALQLVSWSWIARQCDVQIALIDLLLDAGAAADRNPENALINSNFAAAEHLIARGAQVTLPSALCLGRWEDAERLAPAASAADRQFAFILAALKGKAEAVGRILEMGVDLHAPSKNLYSHATAVHHAVCSGSLETVQVLVDAGADLGRKDTVWGATPLGWANYYLELGPQEGRPSQYAEIAAYLREKGPTSG